MKTLTVYLVIALVVSARGYLIKVPTTPVLQPNIAPVGWVNVQKLLLPLFENVCEQSKNPLIVKYSQDFQLDTSNADFSNAEVIKNLLDLKADKGLLHKNEIFTEYKIDYLNELKVIYELFYYANDFNAFYRAACWARQNVNCGLFVDALYSAILNRKDTEKVLIPAPYEILPNYFVRKDFIIKASSLMADDELTLSNSIRNDGNSYILDVNYTTQVYDNADESKLAYFYEDIGLNSYYYLTKLKMSPWINSNQKNNRYGEYLYTLIKQLMARYNLERYANGLPEIEGIDWDNLSKIPYYDPMLIYSNGNEFSSRTLKYVENNEKLTLLKTIENNVETVVTHMREGGFTKADVLNHLMEILVTNEKSYENLALQILNNDTTIYNRPPSVLEHYMTTLRDPTFWAVNKKIVDIVDKALKVLPGYTIDEVYFPGVEVVNVEVKKMMTSFDDFVFDVTDALKMDEDIPKFKVKISQSRLNHKPFSIKVNITSLASQRGLLRIFLGPKVLPGEHALKKNLFMLLDCFEINLKYGSNLITRSSSEISENSDDLLSLYTIRKKISDIEFGLGSIAKLKSNDEQIKFPSRLVIPKGLPEGLPLQLFVYVVPYGKGLGGRLISTQISKDALLSPGFPLDLDIAVQQLFDLPNVLVKDIVVVHKDTDSQTVNNGGRPGMKSWQNNDYNTPSEPVILPLAARPDFTKKQSFDYKSKQGQYGKNKDFSGQKVDYKYKKDYTKVIDKTFDTNDDKYVSNVDVITNRINTYIPDVININKDNLEYLITTEQSFTGGDNFILDKKIQDKGTNEEVHVDVTNNKEIFSYKKPSDFDETIHKVVDKKIQDKGTSEEFHVDFTDEDIVSNKTPKDFDETIHKVIIIHDPIGPFGETLLSKVKDNSNEIVGKKANEHVVIDVTEEDKNLEDMTFENSDEKVNYNKYDVNDNKDHTNLADVSLEDSDEKVKNNKDDVNESNTLKRRVIYDVFHPSVLFYPFLDITGSDEKTYE